MELSRNSQKVFLLIESRIYYEMIFKLKKKL